MNRSDERLHELSRDESVELLQYHSFVGRLAFIVEGRPMVLPVNYVADEAGVVFCTAEGSVLSSVGDGAAVAFEVDDSRPLEHSGWSVLVQGTARAVTDPEELESLRRGPLRSWAAREPQVWVRIAIDAVSGRRLGG
ncbi:MAG: pyridoxamine 5'-phosphate oxidase family protein [Candidatus Dormiibacterota bacterium]